MHAALAGLHLGLPSLPVLTPDQRLPFALFCAAAMIGFGAAALAFVLAWPRR
jgi:hypothetical protein